MAKKKKLTKKQERFVEELVKPETTSQTEAAIKAGYSPKTAKQIAHENLTKPYLIKATERRKRELAILADVKREQVVGAVVAIAFADIDDCHDENGYFDYQKARQNGATGLIKKITRSVGNIAVEFESKLAALRTLGEWMNLKQEAPTQIIIFLTDEDKVRQLFIRLTETRGFEPQLALKAISERFPDIEVEKIIKE